MNEKARNETPATPKRGQAAWNEQRERIAARNDEARRAARTLRAEQDRLRAVAREAAFRRDVVAAANAHPPS